MDWVSDALLEHESAVKLLRSSPNHFSTKILYNEKDSDCTVVGRL
jgi:hypothetical protein